MRFVSLLYHDVVDAGAFDASGFAGPAADSYKLRAADFDRHLARLDGAGVGPPRTTPDADSAPGWALTFDDGGRSALTHVAPRLEGRGWRGHFFVATDYIGRPSFLTGAELRELRGRGHAIGTHSCSHPLRMAACDGEKLGREWRGSVEALSEILGERVTTASVPGGHYSRRVASAAAQAGLRVLFTSEPTLRRRLEGECLVIGRFVIRTGTSPDHAARLARGHLASRLGQGLVWQLKKVPKVLGGDLYLRARDAWLGT